MKRKLDLVCQVLPMPSTDRFMVVTQYVSTGPLHTDNNDGKGYTMKDAREVQAKIRGVK